MKTLRLLLVGFALLYLVQRYTLVIDSSKPNEVAIYFVWTDEPEL